MNRYKLSKAGIDANEGIRRFNNNAEMFEKFLRTFPTDRHFYDMVAAINENNAEEAFKNAHALKGVSGNLSLVNLHADLIPLVELLRSGSLENVNELLDPVAAKYQEVIEALEKM